ncbi:hypothetical protein MMC34_005306 [Xylographa carneopallida]|nr:hypothetical protein [Xylographa carneopallida]
MKRWLPSHEGAENTYRAIYAVHTVLDPMSGPVDGESSPAEQTQKPTKFIGLVTLRSLDADSLALPKELTLPTVATTRTLSIEVAYMFLPSGWGKGYATEAINAVFESCKKTRSFWAPFSKLYVRAIVNESNLASRRVMEKTGMKKEGVYEWSGKAIFLCGEWRERDSLCIFGMHLLE